MKKSELLESMEKILPKSTMGLQPHNLAMAAMGVASWAFVHDKDDDVDASNLKEFLKALEEVGYYEFEEE